MRKIKSFLLILSATPTSESFFLLLCNHCSIYSKILAVETERKIIAIEKEKKLFN
jgi:hypothetical protein